LNLNSHGVALTLNNSAPTFSFIQQALAAGDAVEGNYGMPGGSGHAVNTIGAGMTRCGHYCRFGSNLTDSALDGLFDRQSDGSARA